jgi:hypothetical protein
MFLSASLARGGTLRRYAFLMGAYERYNWNSSRWNKQLSKEIYETRRTLGNINPAMAGTNN